MRAAILLLIAGVGVISPTSGWAADPVSVRFTLDALSVISVGDREFISIPSANLTLRCFPSGAADVLAVRVDPSEFGRRSLSVRGNNIRAELAQPAKGSIRRVGGGTYSVELETVFRVFGTGGATFELPMLLTTETVEAWDADGAHTLEVTGSRLSGTSRVLQLVGKTTMDVEGTGRGAAVYVILSGTLSQMPQF